MESATLNSMDPKNVSKKCLFFVSSKSPKLLLEFQSCHVFVQIVFVYSLACHKHCQTLLLVNLIEGGRPKAKNENKNKDAFPYITVFCLSVCLEKFLKLFQAPTLNVYPSL